MNSGGYTYAKIDVDGTKLWVAGKETALTVGKKASFSGGMPMMNFHSKTLNRTFDVIYFASSLQAGTATAPKSTSPESVPDQTQAPHTGAPIPVTEHVVGIKKAEGGKTIAEIFAQKANLSGKELVVRGKVVKYNGGIMDRNWLHIQDGSGTLGSNDLTVTSTDTAAVGNTVLVRGILATEQDFGGGYKYSIVLEKAKITVE
ncbi:MAG: DNA-binding protein [Deltaproteobacteria bacterium]|nr:DNA-binding protein [Deltaproteobacteria bacterium]